MRLYVLFCLLVLNIICKGQSQTQIDKILNETVNSFTPEAAEKVRLAIRLSDSSGNYRLADLQDALAENFKERMLLDSALVYFKQNIQLLEKEGDSFLLGKAYLGIGFSLSNKSRFTESFENNRKAEGIFRRLNNKMFVGRALKRMGDNLSMQKENDVSALKYYQEALDLGWETGDTVNLSGTYSGMATVYDASHNPTKVNEVLIKSVELGLAAKCYRCLAVSYSQWGIFHHYQGNYRKAIEYYLLEKEMNKRIGNTNEQYFVFQNISEALVGLGEYSKALQYSDSSLSIASKYDALIWHHDVHKARYLIFKGMGDVKKALAELELKSQYADSIFSKEKAKTIEEMRGAYDAERRELQILELEQANTIKDLAAASARQRQIFMVVGLILLIMSVVILFNRYKLKQRTAKALDEKNSELQKLNEFKDKMFAVISHDLRNPVDAFNTIMESLTQNLQHASREELKEFLESTLASAKDLKSLLNNLLEWSLVQIGKLPFNPRPVPLDEIVKTSIGHVDSMAAAKNISIQSEISDDQVMVDKSMITIILRNLLTNAIKFSAPGKTVSLSASRQNGLVTISVRDKGIGMKPEDQAKLFRQEESARSIGSSGEKGAGIGLLLCKELSDKNNGKIYVNSESGKGSTFYLELPVA